MQITTIETMPLGAIPGAAETPPVLETQFPSGETTKKRNVGLTPVVVDMGLATEVPIDRDLVNLGAQHGTNRTQHALSIPCVVPDGHGREALHRVEPTSLRRGGSNIRACMREPRRDGSRRGLDTRHRGRGRARRAPQFVGGQKLNYCHLSLSVGDGR